MNQMRFNIEFHLAMSENLDLFDIARNEDVHLKFLIGGKVAGGRNYIRPVDHLNDLLLRD